MLVAARSRYSGRVAQEAGWFAVLPLVVTLGVLATSTPVLLRAVRVSSPRVAGFPGLPPTAARRSPLRLRTAMIGAAAAVAFPLVLLPVSTVVSVAAAAAGTVAILVAVVLLDRHRRTAERVQQTLASHAPRLSICYSGKSGLHVGMWSPWFERTTIAWCVTVPSDDQFDKVQMHYPDLPIVRGSLPRTVKAAFYPHGASANRKYLSARPDVTHVFLGHGDSDKPLSASERVLDFDLITVAGQAALDRFKAAGVEVPAERLRVIGRPQTEGIVRVDGPVPQPPTVLYAPTLWHEDAETNVSSLPVARQLVDTLLERGCTVVFRRHFARIQHPDAEDVIDWINARLEAHAAETGRAHRWGMEPRLVPMSQLFNEVDTVVSDVSSIVVDFMASDKPYLMYAAQYDDVEAFRADHPTAVGAYAVDRALGNLTSALDDACGSDPLATVRHERADHFLGGAGRRAPAQRFLDLLAELAD